MERRLVGIGAKDELGGRLVDQEVERVDVQKAGDRGQFRHSKPATPVERLAQRRLAHPGGIGEIGLASIAEQLRNAGADLAI